MPKCDTCKKFMLDCEVSRHKCPPRFECIDLDDLEQFDHESEDGDEPPTWTPVYDSTATCAVRALIQANERPADQLRALVEARHVLDEAILQLEILNGEENR